MLDALMPVWIVALALFAACAPAQAQSSSSLSSNDRGEWSSSGMPAIHKQLSPNGTDDTFAINTALASCPDGEVRLGGDARARSIQRLRKLLGLGHQRCLHAIRKRLEAPIHAGNSSAQAMTRALILLKADISEVAKASRRRGRPSLKSRAVSRPLPSAMQPQRPPTFRSADYSGTI
jgi:hypothetical protein